MSEPVFTAISQIAMTVATAAVTAMTTDAWAELRQRLAVSSAAVTGPGSACTRGLWRRPDRH